MDLEKSFNLSKLEIRKVKVDGLYPSVSVTHHKEETWCPRQTTTPARTWACITKPRKMSLCSCSISLSLAQLLLPGMQISIHMSGSLSRLRHGVCLDRRVKRSGLAVASVLFYVPPVLVCCKVLAQNWWRNRFCLWPNKIVSSLQIADAFLAFPIGVYSAYSKEIMHGSCTIDGGLV